MNVFRFLTTLAFAAVLPAAFSQPAAPPAAEVVPQPTELLADLIEMRSTDTETHVVCTGNVVLTGTNMKIACDRLEIIATRIGDEDDTIGTLEKFKYLLATGNVRMNQDEREVTCQRAEVLPLEEIVTLTGDPVLIDRSSDLVAAGETIILRRGEREVTVIRGRVTGPPIKDLGAEAKKDEPAPDVQP